MLATDRAESGRAPDTFRFWRSLGLSATLTSSAALAGILIEFVSLGIAVRTLPKAAVGAFAIFLVAGRVLQMLTDCGVRQALVQTLASRSAAQKETFHAALAIAALTSTLVASVLLLGRNYLSLGGIGTPTYVTFLAAYVLSQAPHQVFSATLQGLRLYRSFAIGELSRSVMRLAGLYVFVVHLGMGLDGLLLATVVSPLLASLVQACLIPFPILPRTIDIRRALRLLQLAYPLGLTSLLGVISDRLSRVILVASYGTVAVAMLEIASKAVDASIQCYMGFQSAFFPVISRLLGEKNETRASQALNQTVRLVAFGVAPIAIAVVMERDLIIRLLFSGAYAETSWAFALLFSTLTIALVNNLLHTTMIGAGDTKAAFAMSLLQTAVSLALCLICIPRYGYLGAVYAFVGSNYAVNPALVWRLRKLGIRVNVMNYAIPVLLVGVVVLVSATGSGTAWGVVSLTALAAVAILGNGLWARCLTSYAARKIEGHVQRAPNGRGGGQLRILVVTERYPPHHDGGYEIACQRTVNSLRSRGHAVTVLTSRQEQAEEESQDGVHRLLHRLMPQPRPSLSPRYIGRELLRAWGLRINSAIAVAVCRRTEPDILFAWQTDGIGIGTVAAPRFPGCPVVHRLDDITLALLLERLEGEKNPVWKATRSLVYGVGREDTILPHAVTVSRFLKQRYIDAGVNGEAITVIPNGIPETWVSEQADVVCRGEEIKLVVAGRIREDKGIHVVVRALAELASDCEQKITLDIVGEAAGAYRQYLEELIHSLGLQSRVRFCGAYDPDSMMRVYDAADILLLPSLVMEGFGLTLIEAMARGRPVIAVNRGGPLDIVVDGLNGLLVEPDDPAAIAAAVRRLVRDEEFRSSVQRAALGIVRQRFTIEGTVRTLEEYLFTLRPHERTRGKAA